MKNKLHKDLTETAMEILDDVLYSRNQNGTDEQGIAALKTQWPELDEAECKRLVRRWRKEVEANSGGVPAKWPKDCSKLGF